MTATSLTIRVLAASLLLSVVACSDLNGMFEPAIDQDIASTRDSGMPTLRNLSAHDTAPMFFGPVR